MCLVRGRDSGATGKQQQRKPLGQTAHKAEMHTYAHTSAHTYPYMHTCPHTHAYMHVHTQARKHAHTSDEAHQELSRGSIYSTLRKTNRKLMPVYQEAKFVINEGPLNQCKMQCVVAGVMCPTK